MRMMLTGLAATVVGSPRIWRKRALYVALCTTAVFFGWLAIRLQVTYLPPPEPWLAYDFLGGYKVDQTDATAQCGPVDLPRLEERVRRTAQAVLPSVVAVRPLFEKPLGENFASGVIITADGIMLSQGDVSHWKFRDTIRPGSSPTGSAGDRTTVILHDGRECPAELLGANRTHDVFLLRLLEPGPYPQVPIRATAPVAVGDWVLKIGHPLGYRKGQSAPVRLGRVIGGTVEIFGTDCMLTGGDSGGPYFSFDGQFVGFMYYIN